MHTEAVMGWAKNYGVGTFVHGIITVNIKCLIFCKIVLFIVPMRINLLARYCRSHLRLKDHPTGIEQHHAAR
jgi:hypothetical protein